MKVLGMYQYHNLPMFKDGFTLNLDYEGITVIRGNNKNAKMEGRNNGSGKSLSMAGLAEVLISSNPAIVGNEAAARKALFPYPDSKITLEVDGTLVVKGRFGGSVVNYGIEDRSGGIEKVKRDVAFEYLAENLGYNHDSFYTLVFLDGGRNFPLVTGTPTQRIQFLSNIFEDVESHDWLHRHFADKEKVLKSNSHLLSEMRDQLSEIESAGSESVDTEDLAKIKKGAQCHKASYEGAYKTAAYLTNVLEIRDILKPTAFEWDLTKESLASFIKDQLVSSKAASSRDSLLENVGYYADEVSAAKKRLKKFMSTNPDLDDSEYGFISESSEIDGLEETLDKLTALLKKNTSLLPHLDISKIGTVGDLSYLAGSIFSLIYFIENSKHINIATAPKITKSEYAILQDIAKTMLSVSSELDSNDPTSVVTLKTVDKEKVLAARANVEKLGHLKARVAECEETYKSYSDKLEATPEVEAIDSETLDRLSTLLVDFKRSLEELGDIEGINISRKSLAKAIKLRDTSYEKYKELALEYSELKSSIKAVEINKKSLKGLKERVKELSKSPKQLVVMEALKKAFSNKGIRVNLLARKVSVLTESMNKFSYLVFPEPMQFEFRLQTNSCDILVIRNPGTKEELISDIRLMSRSETKSFCLLLLYSLLPMIPSSRRLNIAVLDEMVSNMDKVTRTMFYEDYVPALAQIVPHVIVLDTGDQRIDGAQNFTVTKEGGKSTLTQDAY